MTIAQSFDRLRLPGIFLPASEFLLGLFIMGILNASAWVGLRGVGLSAVPLPQGFDLHSFNLHHLQLALAILACNLAALTLIIGISRRILQPWRRITSIMRHAPILNDERGEVAVTSRSVRDMAGVIARFASQAQDAYIKCRALQCELDESRQMLAQIMMQHQVAISSTNRELVEQYRSVLAYANYLDEHIRSHRSDAQLRFDFDDVCESGFNLKLIAQSLELLRHHAQEPKPVPLSSLLQQTVIALAPSLERRAMKLSTAGVDENVVASTDVRLLSHAVWMMLLGTIRYAAAESTLRLRCFRAKDGNAIVSIGVSELEPGQLTPEERHAHMVRQLQHRTPHMFAETIRLQANGQLAQLMLERAGGQLQVLPINTHACEISIILPSVKK